MGFFNFNKNKKTEVIVNERNGLFKSFSTPFGKIGGKGSLNSPYIRAYSADEPYIRFGEDNLYPQIINQLYFQSPLNGAIINYKSNAVIGGGFDLKMVDENSGKDKVDVYTFLKKNNYKKLLRQTTKDLIVHGRICVIVKVDNNGKLLSVKRVGPEKVRNNKAKTIFTVSDDWSLNSNMAQYPKYSEKGKGCEMLYCFETDDDCGQDIYPLPQYVSSLNWAFLDSEISYLQKSNIINSVFPSFMIKLKKKFGSNEELEQFKKTVNGAKGAPEAGRILTFVAEDLDSLPEITNIPVSTNPDLFKDVDVRIDAQICRAHNIDPLLMGIRVSGSLGQGNELSQSYTIFEKNVVMPLRNMMAEFSDYILGIAELNATTEITNFQIIDNQIVEKDNGIDENAKIEADAVNENQNFQKDVQTINESLKGLTAKENQDMMRIVRDFSKGRLNEILAIQRLGAYGIDEATAKQILDIQ